MFPALAILLNLAAGTTLAVVGSRQLKPGVRHTRAGAIAIAAMPLASAAVLLLYVSGEDDYRGTGQSRWDAYDGLSGPRGTLFVVSIASMLTCFVGLVHAQRARRERFLQLVSFFGGLASILVVTASLVSFSGH